LHADLDVRGSGETLEQKIEMMNKKSALIIIALISLSLADCRRSGTIVKDLDKAKLRWQWQPQKAGDQASEFRVKCGTVSGRYDLAVVRVPFPNLEAPIKQIVTRPGRYFCVVTAANNAGESSPTNEISFKIEAKKGEG